MSEKWITDRPPTVDEVGNADVCLIADQGGDPFVYSGKSARELWGEKVTAWMLIPYVPPEPDMPERVWVWRTAKGELAALGERTVGHGYEYRRVVRAKRESVGGALGWECSRCGKIAYSGDRFCAKCGAEFDD